jgi:hypothetical protein
MRNMAVEKMSLKIPQLKKHSMVNVIKYFCGRKLHLQQNKLARKTTH